ncbi:MAG: baseplate complex protein [Methylobacter sp.]
MSLHLNGTKVPGYNQKISIDLKFPSEDMSGNGSATTKAEKGDKGKTLKMTTLIRYVDADQLSLLTNLAEAKDSNGERVRYQIVNDMANAMNMRQGFFDESCSVKENDSTQDWTVNFTLSEHQSVPEQKEARKTEKKVTEQPAKGTQSGGNTSAPAAVTDQAVELTPAEKSLKVLDDFLAKH